MGAYHPAFHFAEPLTLTELPAIRAGWRNFRTGIRTTISALAILAASCLAILFSHRAPSSSVELFLEIGLELPA